MPFRILSIDGGGLRGIIPLLILEHLLKITGKKNISDSFDLITGTSTGGIIACALSLKLNGVNVFSIDQLKNLYITHGKDIFPGVSDRFWRTYREPKYNIKGLNKVLSDYFGETTLQDCKTPVLIPAYDVNNYSPFYYTSRNVNPTSPGYLSEPPKLVDICRSTSAAPTYFSSHYFTLFSSNKEDHSFHNLIDGGVFVNNPSLAALCEVLEHSKNPLYRGSEEHPVQIEDIYILSLGTGKSAKTITESEGKNWGKVDWAKNLFDIMMQGNSQSVHNQMEVIMNKINKKGYLRLEISIPSEASEMDDSSDPTREVLEKKVISAITNNEPKKKEIEAFVKNAGL